jgi:hypothetical protein
MCAGIVYGSVRLPFKGYLLCIYKRSRRWCVLLGLLFLNVVCCSPFSAENHFCSAPADDRCTCEYMYVHIISAPLCDLFLCLAIDLCPSATSHACVHICNRQSAWCKRCLVCYCLICFNDGLLKSAHNVSIESSFWLTQSF